MKNGGYRSSTAKKKAIVVVAHAMIVIIWHILATGKPYHELGADYFTTRLDPERETRHSPDARLLPPCPQGPAAQEHSAAATRNVLSGLLEPDAGKLASPVLKGPGRGNALRLPDPAARARPR